MRLPGATGQATEGEYLFDASGTISSGSAAQLLLPKARRRSSLIIQNLHASATMYVEFGGARATATLTSGAITSITITNGGFGYNMIPVVEFLGGAYDSSYQTTPAVSTNSLPDYPAPTGTLYRRAKGHAVLTTGVVTSIVIDDPGAGYAYPPYIFIKNQASDPFGCANPFYSSTASGIELIAPGGSLTQNGTITTTDQCAIYCATATAPFTCKFSL